MQIENHYSLLVPSQSLARLSYLISPCRQAWLSESRGASSASLSPSRISGLIPLAEYLCYFSVDFLSGLSRMSWSSGLILNVKAALSSTLCCAKFWKICSREVYWTPYSWIFDSAFIDWTWPKR